MHLNELFLEKDQCPQWGLNSRPLVYKTSALPLSYRGDRRKAMDGPDLSNKTRPGACSGSSIILGQRGILRQQFLLKTAPSEDWTHDRWFTRPALYLWAIEATERRWILYPLDSFLKLRFLFRDLFCRRCSTIHGRGKLFLPFRPTAPKPMVRNRQNCPSSNNDRTCT